MESDDPIRVWLWEKDGTAAGEFIPAPGHPRPSQIGIVTHAASGHGFTWARYAQDPRNADRYVRE